MLVFATTALAGNAEPIKVTSASGTTVEVKFDQPEIVTSWGGPIGTLFASEPEFVESMGFHFSSALAGKISVKTEIIGANVELVGAKSSKATVKFDKNGKASGLFLFRGNPFRLALEANGAWIVQTRVEFTLDGESVPFAVAMIEYTPQGVVLKGFQSTTEPPVETALAIK